MEFSHVLLLCFLTTALETLAYHDEDNSNIIENDLGYEPSEDASATSTSEQLNQLYQFVSNCCDGSLTPDCLLKCAGLKSTRGQKRLRQRFRGSGGNRLSWTNSANKRSAGELLYLASRGDLAKALSGMKRPSKKTKRGLICNSLSDVWC